MESAKAIYSLYQHYYFSFCVCNKWRWLWTIRFWRKKLKQSEDIQWWYSRCDFLFDLRRCVEYSSSTSCKVWLFIYCSMSSYRNELSLSFTTYYCLGTLHISSSFQSWDVSTVLYVSLYNVLISCSLTV